MVLCLKERMLDMEFDNKKAKRVLIPAVMEAQANSVMSTVPEKGIFSPVCWAMRYPGTEHEGRLYTQHSQEHGCVIRASMIVNGTSREVSNHVFFGSRQECLDWLKEESHVEELIGIYDHLVESADKE